MFCQKCGKEIADQAKFCNHCGSAVNHTQPQQPAQPQVAQQTAAAASVSTACCAQPQQSASTASYAAPAVQGRPVNMSVIFAGIFFQLATLLGMWSVFSPYNNYFDRLGVAVRGSCCWRSAASG